MPDTIFLKLYRIKQIIRKCFVVDCFLITSTCPPLDHIGPGTRLAVAIIIMTSVSKIHSFLGYIFVVLPSSSLYVDEDFSILGALSLDVFVISYKNTIPGPIAVLPMLYVSRDHPAGKSIWRLLGAISRFIDKMQFGSLLPLFFLILFYSFY